MNEWPLPSKTPTAAPKGNHGYVPWCQSPNAYCKRAPHKRGCRECYNAYRASSANITPAQQSILDYFARSKADVITLEEVVEATGLSGKSNVVTMIGKLVKKGKLRRVSRYYVEGEEDVGEHSTSG